MNQKFAEYYKNQARWNRPLRQFIYRKISLALCNFAIEVGCGTGDIASEVAQSGVKVTGVDVDPVAIEKASDNFPSIDFVALNSKHSLPFDDGAFDLAYCHFVLMWNEHPEKVMREMARVVRHGGWIVAMAEPDYGGRLSYPEDGLAAPLAESLQRQGADPYFGRRLRDVFAASGIQAETGVWPSMAPCPCSNTDFATEWDFYLDQAGELADQAEFSSAHASAQTANREERRTVFLPIFYAIGKRE